MNQTKWVATWYPEDGGAVHAQGTREEIEQLVARVASANPDWDPPEVVEVPATWECSGEDGCLTT